MKKRILSLCLALALLCSLLPTLAAAAGDDLLLARADCTEIGTNESFEAPIYLYDGEVPEGAANVVFTDFADTMESGSICYAYDTSYASYIMGENTAPLGTLYALDIETFAGDEDMVLTDAYADYDFSGCYAYFLMDDDMEMAYFLIKMPASSEEPLPFAASAGGAALTEIVRVPGGYTYQDDWSDDTADLYLVTVPFGTEEATLDFGEKTNIAYYYNDAGYIDAASSTGATTMTVKTDFSGDGTFAYVRVQNPYSADWMSGGELLYAVQFRYPFTVTAGGETLTDITVKAGGYRYIGYGASEGVDYDLYVVSVPEGAEEVSFSFTSNCLAYNYKAVGSDPAVADDNDFSTFIGQMISDYMAGQAAYTLKIDNNNDGAPDYIQVQDPYSAGGAVRYAVTFDASGSGGTGGDDAPATVEELIANIAAKYAESGTAGDPNAPWLTADMMAYAKTFPESESVLSETQKQAMVDEAAAKLSAESLSVSDAAKYVIALVAMGYDPARITVGTGETLDARAKLDATTFTAEGDVTEAAKNAYVIPYVIIAYQQFSDTAEKLGKLTAAAIEGKDGWMDTTWGVDAITPALLALAPYADTDDAVKTAIGEGAAAVKAAQGEDGALGFSSVGLAIAGLTAAGEDVSAIKTGDKSLIDGLLSGAASTKDGFEPTSSSFMTEQGFRGLIALQNEPGYRLYDFSGQELTPAVSGFSGAVTTFTVIPESASVTVTADGGTVAPKAGRLYDLPEGTYSYTVTAEGYEEKSGTLEISAADASAHAQKTVSVSLTSSGAGEGEETVSVTVRLLVHDADTCDNKLVYKENPGAFFSLLNGDSYTVTLEKGVGTARDALVLTLDAAGLDYFERSNGYFPTIGGYTEFEHGENSGWLFMVNGEPATSAAQQYVFTADGEVLWWFTDDYTKEYGSEQWLDDTGETGGGSSAASGTPAAQGADDGDFVDVPKNAWYYEDVQKVHKLGLMNGVSETEFAPGAEASRGMIAVILYRLAGEPAADGAQALSDVTGSEYYAKAAAWAASVGVFTGHEDGTFRGADSVTREQLIALLYRYAQKMGMDVSARASLDAFEDASQVSGYAREAMEWAVAVGLVKGVDEKTLAPGECANRAQLASLLVRFDALSK